MVKDAPKGKTQKVIIPRGTIDSADTTILEIPVKLHNQPVVVAKRKHSEKSFNFDGNDFTFEGRSRDASFMPHQRTVLTPESFADFNARAGHHSSIIEDKRSYGTSMQRPDYQEDDYYRRPVLRSSDRFPPPPPPQPPPTRSNAHFSGDIHQQPLSGYDRRPFPNDYMPYGPQPTDHTDVDEIEEAETQLILDELKKYHQARRRFLEDASAIATKSNMRLPSQSGRTESYCPGPAPRSYERPQRDVDGICGRQSEPSYRPSCPHCTPEPKISTRSCRDVPTQSYACQTEAPVRTVCPPTPTVYHKMPQRERSSCSLQSSSSGECRVCCNPTEKCAASDDERHLQTEARERPVERKEPAPKEEATYGREGKAIGTTRSRRSELNPTSSGLVRPRSSPHNTSRSSKNIKTTESPTDNQYSPQSKRNVRSSSVPEEFSTFMDSSSNDFIPPFSDSSSDHDRNSRLSLYEQDPIVQNLNDARKSAVRSSKVTEPKEIIGRASKSTEFENYWLNAEIDDGDTRDTPESPPITESRSKTRTWSRPQPQKTVCTTCRPLDSASGVNCYENQSESRSKTRTCSRPQPQKTVCTTCRPVDSASGVKPVPSIMTSEELKKIREQFKEATRRLQKAFLAAVPPSGVCGSKSGTFPCQQE